MGYNYRKHTVRDHPRADSQGHVAVHVLIAERALGRYLPEGAHVHHVDGDSLNNANRNLVICQNAAYHKLLHLRTRTLRAGGDPNTEKLCMDCGRCKPFSSFNKRRAHKSIGLQSVCRDCQHQRWEDSHGS